MSSNLLDKSRSNYKAALIFTDQHDGHYCTGIHCSYYSVVQILIHLLIHHYGKSEEDIKYERGKIGIHQYITTFFFEELAKISYKDAMNFKNNLLQLKSLRVNSDYHDIRIDKNQHLSALTLSDILNTILKRNYSI